MDEVILKGFLIDGKVQKAGFRSKVKELAKAHKLRGFAQNLRNYDESVLVVCKGNLKNIRAFEEDLNGLITDEGKILRDKRRLEGELSKITDSLDAVLTSKGFDGKKESAIPLLERRKSLLRRLKEYKIKQTPYMVEKITPLQDLGTYQANIDAARYGDNFKLVRDDEELGVRLDEGIKALTGLENASTDLNYEIIDTDFAIIDIKYGSLNDSLQKGFASFPVAFAKALDVVLDERYGIKPKKSKKKTK
jgi:acylphosphatase